MITHHEPPSTYDVAALKAGLRTTSLGKEIHCHGSLDSTNATALALAREGASHGTVILADTQRAGRGRHGRTWHSPPEQHVYCSIILRMAPNRSTLLTLVPLLAAMAVTEAVEDAAAITSVLKWPNDVLVGEKKLAGILCESFVAPTDTAVVVGIGINVNARPDDFPPPLRDTVATVLAERGAPIDRGRLVTALLNRLDGWLARLAPEHSGELISAYSRRCATLGRRVRATLSSNESLEGIAESIGADGCLRIRLSELGKSSERASCIEVRSAEVHHLRGVTGTAPLR